MPLTELIPNQENREFDASSGDWYGDQGWNAGPIGPRTGLMTLPEPLNPLKAQTNLAYPNVILPAFAIIQFTIMYGVPPPQPSGYAVLMSITDGVITILQTGGIIASSPPWYTHQLTFYTPKTWKKKTGVLFITSMRYNDPEGTLYIDHITTHLQLLPWPAQYLPIVGVG